MQKYKKYLFFGTVGLFAYMPFHIFLSQWLSTFTGGLDAWKIGKDVFTAALVSVMVLTVLFTRKYTRAYLGLVAFAVVYLLLHLVLLITTAQPYDTGLLATVYNNRLVWYVLIGYSLALLAPRLAQPRFFIKVLLVVSTLVCLVGLAQWFLPKDVMTYFGYSIDRGVKPNFFIDDKPDLPRIFSTIRDPNSLGAFLILPSTIIVAALARYWKTERRMLLSGLLLLHGLTLLLTFSRSAWIGTFVAHAVVAILIFRHHIWVNVKRFAVPLVLTAALLVGFVFVMRDQYFVQHVVFHADENTQLDDPNELRLKLYEKGIDGIISQPLGYGPGTAGLVSTKLPNGLLTENYYLQIGYEVGVIGLLGLVGFLAFLAWRLWLLRHSGIAQILLASFAGLAFMNLLLHTWANEAVAVAWFMLAGLYIGIKTVRSKF